MTELDRRTYLKTAGIVAAGTVGLAGCAGTASATGTLATQVTDQPGDIADFKSCVVTIQGICVAPAAEGDTVAQEETADSGSTEIETVVEQAADDVDEGDDREYHEFDEPREADLVQLQDGDTDLIDERDLEVGTYDFLQLDVTGVEGVLADSGEVQVDTPGDAG